jgi:hypothetical protein
MPEQLLEPTPTLWIGSCPVCSGEGTVALSAFGLEAPDPTDRISCRHCGGTGADPDRDLERRRLRGE